MKIRERIDIMIKKFFLVLILTFLIPVRSALAVYDKGVVESKFITDLYYFKSSDNNKIDVHYFSQNDARWSFENYGIGNMYHTGCVPTSLAMIISSYKANVLPNEIAKKLYDNTPYFNKKTSGTYAEGVSYILDMYNLKYKVLNDINSVKEELKKGNLIFAAVDNKPFTVDGYSHAVVLSGLDNNITTVYNPYTRFGSQKNYNIYDVWKQKSKDKDNLGLGSPFIVVYK